MRQVETVVSSPIGDDGDVFLFEILSKFGDRRLCSRARKHEIETISSVPTILTVSKIAEVA
jgi:hypothetical protein